MFAHTSFGWCFWDLPSLIVLIAMVVVFVVHRFRQHKRQKNFEDELADRMAGDTLRRG